jgi:Ca2+-binding EF-hand superfamily protein
MNFFNALHDSIHTRVSENDVSVHQFFEENDDDSDGKITEKNFVDFYEKMSKEKRYLVT